MNKKTNVEEMLESLTAQLAAIQRDLKQAPPRVAPAKNEPKKKAVWETMKSVRIKSATGRTGTEVSLCAFGGRRYVNVVRLVAGKDGDLQRKKGVAVEVGALKAALGKLDF